MTIRNILVGIGVGLISIGLAFGVTTIFSPQWGSLINASVPTPGKFALTGTAQAQFSDVESVSVPPDQLTDRPFRVGNNCTFSLDDWLQYPEAWPVETFSIGNYTYTRGELLNLFYNDNNDTRSRLIAQSVAVILNQENGADVTELHSTFIAVISWLNSFPPGSDPSAANVNKAETLIDTLERFNTGREGSPPCAYLLSQTTPKPRPPRLLVITSPTSTLTLRAIIRYQPSWTPSRGNNDPKPPANSTSTSQPIISTPYPPSLTPIPPSSTPIPPQPTQPPTEAPTDEPNNPTVEPTAQEPDPTQPPDPTNPSDPTVPPDPTDPPENTEAPPPTRIPPPTKTPRPTKGA